MQTFPAGRIYSLAWRIWICGQKQPDHSTRPRNVRFQDLGQMTNIGIYTLWEFQTWEMDSKGWFLHKESDDEVEECQILHPAVTVKENVVCWWSRMTNIHSICIYIYIYIPTHTPIRNLKYNSQLERRTGTSSGGNESYGSPLPTSQDLPKELKSHSVHRPTCSETCLKTVDWGEERYRFKK